MATIYLKNGGFHLRLYSSVNLTTGQPLTTLGRDSKPLRKQQTVLLARKDETHTSDRCTAVLLLANAKVAEIARWEEAVKNGEEARPTGDMTIAAFWNAVFLPYIKREKAHSTVKTYEGYWRTYLRSHFNGTRTFANYESFIATNFLEQLATEYSKNTVRHVRAVGSAIFAYAIAKGLIKASGDDTKIANPWFHARKNIKCSEVEDTYAYNEKEVEQILDALEHVSTGGSREEYSAKISGMLLTVCFYGGLRPSEAAGLKWENVNLNEGTMTICSAYVSGKFKDETKTGEDRIVAMLPQLHNRFKIWATIWHHPTNGLVFPNKSGNAPINVNDMGARVIKTTLEKVGLDWHGFYSARRGFGTELFNHGATVEEIAASMGNSIAVAYRNYIKDKSKTGAKGVEKWATAHALADDTDKRRRFKDQLALTGGVGQ